jgi:hypothetical protein
MTQRFRPLTIERVALAALPLMQESGDFGRGFSHALAT